MSGHGAERDVPRSLTTWCSSCLPGKPCFVHDPVDCSPPAAPPRAEKDVHWGSVNARPTSLHGNGAASFDRATLNWHAVTCRLCLSLRGSENVPCPDKACSATHPGACRYPGWQMCMHPARVTPPGGSDA